jgi:hypothetical protein
MADPWDLIAIDRRMPLIVSDLRQSCGSKMDRKMDARTMTSGCAAANGGDKFDES